MPASAQSSRVGSDAPETNPEQSSFIDAVVSRMTMTSISCGVPPFIVAVAEVFTVIGPTPSTLAKKVGTVACCCTTIAFDGLQGMPVLVRHLAWG
jgi:hypothetical protein